LKLHRVRIYDAPCSASLPHFLLLHHTNISPQYPTSRELSKIAESASCPVLLQYCEPSQICPVPLPPSDMYRIPLAQHRWIKSSPERRDALLCAKNRSYMRNVPRCSLSPFAVRPRVLHPSSTQFQNIPGTSPCPESNQKTLTRNPYILPRLPIENLCKSLCRKLYRSKARLYLAMLCFPPTTR
jgi:hypothetical protein